MTGQKFTATDRLAIGVGYVLSILAILAPFALIGGVNALFGGGFA